MNRKIKTWYHYEYVSDEAYTDINDDVTFQDVFVALDNYQDVYKLLGLNCDSVIRERVFLELARLMHVKYDYIYAQWLLKQTREVCY